jgi:hypothetical protein
MVQLHIKRGEESQFLFETTLTTPTDSLLSLILSIYNARLKVGRICGEIQELAKYGTYLPPNILGLTDDQVEELKLVDEWAEICIPSGGSAPLEKDPCGLRNGLGPKPAMVQVLLDTVSQAKDAISFKKVKTGQTTTLKDVSEQIKLLEGAVRIVYPMNLPPHDPIRMEFEDKEELEGSQDSLAVLAGDEAELWFCGKKLSPGKLLGDFLGKNEKSEKTKVVLKLGKKGQGPPGREPILSEEDRKELMMMAYRKQQEGKKLAEQGDQDDGDHCLNSEWADGDGLKRAFHGLQNVSWRPR